MNAPTALRAAVPPLPAEVRAALVEDLARLLIADLARRTAQLDTVDEALANVAARQGEAAGR